MLSFILTAVACGFAALCYAEFAAMVPISGSAYTYAYASLGEFVAWIIGWDLIIEYAVGNIGVAIGWSGYFRELISHFGIELPAWLATDPRSARHGGRRRSRPGATDAGQYSSASALTTAPVLFGLPIIANLPAFLAVAVITVVLVIGIKESANTNNAMVLLKIGIILFFIAVGMLPAPARQLDRPGAGRLRPERLRGDQRRRRHHLLQLHRIRRRLHRGGGSQGSRQGHAVRHHHEPGDLHGALHRALAGDDRHRPVERRWGRAEPMITALTHADGPPRLLNASRFIISLGAVIAMGSVLLVFQLGQPRIFFSMSRDGLLPPVFAKVHPRFKTPYVGTILTGIFVAVFAAFANIAEVVDLTNIGTLFAFVLVSLGVIVLRCKEPDRVRAVPGALRAVHAADLDRRLPLPDVPAAQHDLDPVRGSGCWRDW